MIPVNAISHRRVRARRDAGADVENMFTDALTRRIAVAAVVVIYVRDCVVIGFGHDNDLKIGVFVWVSVCVLNRKPIVQSTAD